MESDHAEMFKKRMSCPACSGAAESYFANGYQCNVCGRRESLFLKAFGVHEPTKQDEDEFAIHTLNLQLADLTERCESHKANYEYMAKRAAEQQQEIEAASKRLLEWIAVSKKQQQQIAELTEYHQQLIAANEVARNEGDELLRKWNLDPEIYRTDGGVINHMKVRAALLHPDEYQQAEPAQIERE